MRPTASTLHKLEDGADAKDKPRPTETSSNKRRSAGSGGVKGAVNNTAEKAKKAARPSTSGSNSGPKDEKPKDEPQDKAEAIKAELPIGTATNRKSPEALKTETAKKQSPFETTKSPIVEKSPASEQKVDKTPAPTPTAGIPRDGSKEENNPTIEARSRAEETPPPLEDTAKPDVNQNPSTAETKPTAGRSSKSANSTKISGLDGTAETEPISATLNLPETAKTEVPAKSNTPAAEMNGLNDPLISSAQASEKDTLEDPFVSSSKPTEPKAQQLPEPLLPDFEDTKPEELLVSPDSTSANVAKPSEPENGVENSDPVTEATNVDSSIEDKPSVDSKPKHTTPPPQTEKLIDDEAAKLSETPKFGGDEIH